MIDLASETLARVTDKTCAECGGSFHALRSDAKYCSGNCRKQSSRRKERIRRAAKNAIAHVLEIRRLSAQYPDMAIVAALELEKVSSEIGVTLARVTDSMF